MSATAHQLRRRRAVAQEIMQNLKTRTDVERYVKVANLPIIAADFKDDDAFKEAVTQCLASYHTPPAVVVVKETATAVAEQSEQTGLPEILPEHPLMTGNTKKQLQGILEAAGIGYDKDSNKSVLCQLIIAAGLYDEEPAEQTESDMAAEDGYMLDEMDNEQLMVLAGELGVEIEPEADRQQVIDAISTYAAEHGTVVGEAPVEETEGE